MKIKIYNLPDDIVKKVTYKNWKKYWPDVIYEDEYVWAPKIMYKMIDNIVKSMKSETSREWNKRVMSKANLKKFAKNIKKKDKYEKTTIEEEVKTLHNYNDNNDCCLKCGKKYGNHKKKFMGMWKGKCSICHKKNVPCASAGHDFGINITDREFELSNSL